jgi:hypothetical protein
LPRHAKNRIKTHRLQIERERTSSPARTGSSFRKRQRSKLQLDEKINKNQNENEKNIYIKKEFEPTPYNHRVKKINVREYNWGSVPRGEARVEPYQFVYYFVFRIDL